MIIASPINEFVFKLVDKSRISFVILIDKIINLYIYILLFSRNLKRATYYCRMQTKGLTLGRKNWWI